MTAMITNSPDTAIKVCLGAHVSFGSVITYPWLSYLFCAVQQCSPPSTIHQSEASYARQSSKRLKVRMKNEWWKEKCYFLSCRSVNSLIISFFECHFQTFSYPKVSVESTKVCKLSPVVGI